MKHLLITIAALGLVGCGKSQKSATTPDTKKQTPTTIAPGISIHQAVKGGNIEVIKQRLAAGTDVDEKDVDLTP